MKNVRVYKFNGYATGNSGKEYRAVAVAGHWRLCVQKKPGSDVWLFVNNTEYATVHNALADVDFY